MAGQPHDKTGRKCSVCQIELTKSSMTMTIQVKEGGFIVSNLACPKCHDEFYSKGE